MNAIIRWVEDSRGVGFAILEWDNGDRETVPCDEPITDCRDSHAWLAAHFPDLLGCEVQRERDHIIVKQELQADGN